MNATLARSNQVSRADAWANVSARAVRRIPADTEGSNREAARRSTFVTEARTQCSLGYEGTFAKGELMRRLLWVGLMLSSSGSAWAQVDGTVRYVGPTPKPEPLDLRTDPVCSTLEPHAVANHTLVGENGGLANVFAYVENPPATEAPTPAEPVILDQQACRYAPKVFGIRVGQSLEIRNGDATVHTVHAELASGFNVVTPRRGQRVHRVFRTPKVMVPIRCDVHPWMAAYAGVMAHPYFAVTDRAGRFSIPGRWPDGRYTLAFWHEKLGRASAQVEVVQGRAQANVEFRSATK